MGEENFGLWSRIPLELRERPQWCLAGPDKRPLTVDGWPASVTNANTWTDFEAASQSAALQGLNIGYIQTAEDPFSCIDIDVKDTTSPEDMERFEAIIEQLDSYTERSQSGKGFHIWVCGKIGQGRRRDGIEVYSQERFMICTGNVERERPIAERRALLVNMIAQMAPDVRHGEPLTDRPDLDSDAEIVDRALAAKNGKNFAALYNGDFQQIGHTDHSRADMALIAMLAFYTRNNEQLKRLFLQSALGQRDKSQKRKDYVDRTIRAVRVAQAEGPTVEHGMEMALAIISGALAKYLAPMATPTPDDNGLNLLNRLNIDWTTGADAEVPDIVDGLVADEDVTLLGGHGGVGKGFVALQMACAIALGEPILGCETRKSRVLYYSAEDGRKRMTRRLRSIVSTFDYDEQGLRNNLCVLDASEVEPLYGEGFEKSPDGKRFARIMGPSADFENLLKMVKEFDPQLVVVDGASDTFDGNEIARREVRAFIKMLRRIHPSRKIGVLLIVHIDRSSARGFSTNDDGYAGSAQWHNSCRRRMYLHHQVKKEKDDDGEYVVVDEKFVLRVMKNQDGLPLPDKELQRGDFGLWQMDVTIGGALSPTDVPDYEDAVVRLIRKYYERHEYMSTSLAPQAQTGVYSTLKGDPEFPRGLNRKKTTEIVRTLKRNGMIVEEPYKRPNRSWGERWVVLRDPDSPFEMNAPSAQTGTEN